MMSLNLQTKRNPRIAFPASLADCHYTGGDSRKNRVDAAREIPTITSRFLKAVFSRSTSLVPIASPVPMIGPISGEMSIAPMMTAVEFTLRPTEAMMIENARIQTV